jgi:hypothetical protein
MPVRPNASKRIDAYLAKLPPFSRAICTKLRELIHVADPDIVEDWKWGPNFYHDGMVCGFWGLKKWVTFNFYNGAVMKDSKKLFNHGLDNLRTRAIKFTDLSQVKDKEVIAYIKEAVRNNRSGKPKAAPRRRAGSEVPSGHLKKALIEKNLLLKFKERPHYQKRDYIQWVTSPKQEETKQRRILILLRDLQEGTYMKMKYAR